MATITAGEAMPWENYHRTNQVDGARTALMDVTDLLDLSWSERWAITAGLLRAHIADALANGDRAGLIGRAWSLSHLTGNPGLQLDCGGRSAAPDENRGHSGLTGCGWLLDAHRHPGSPFPAGLIAMVGGGTTFREITRFAKPDGRSIRTSGSHLTASIAGAIATGTHGSRLGDGAVQDQVVGFHIITGPETSVWIEPASTPVLSDAAAIALDDQVEIIRDDALFADALIHLGGMGAINGVAMRTVPDHGYRVQGTRTSATDDLPEQLAAGDFAAIAEPFGFSGYPAFYEVTLDHRAFAPGSIHRSAFHTFYLTDEELPTSDEEFIVPRAADWLKGWADALGGGEKLWEGGPGGGPPQEFPPAADYYHQTSYSDFVTRMATDSTHSWDNIHGDAITGNEPGRIYSSALAVDRAQLPTVLPLIARAIAALPSMFLLTLRFVTNAAGTMAFTRFPETAVIDFEGPSRLWLSEEGIPPQTPVPAQVAVQLVRRTLTDAAIPYVMHWAKQGAEPGDHPPGVDEAALIERNFGPADDPASPLARWRAMRARLLTPAMQRVFVNDALIEKGLVLPPASA